MITETESPVVRIVNFGCKVNQSENSRLEEEIRKRGASVTDDDSIATDFVINTCAVTANAEREVRQLARRLARSRPDARLYLMGCYVDRDAAKLLSLPGLRGVFRNGQKDDVARAIVPERRTPLAAASGARSRTRAFLKIQDGCNLACAFCIIPELRGRTIRSTPPSEVVSRLAQFASAGYPEVVLTGVLLGAYGSDLTPRVTLLELVERLGSAHTPPIRISSIEPWRLDRTLARAFASTPIIRPHFHIPIQSGSASVLRQMNRHLDLEELAAVLESILQARPDASIGTDLITGFPGETERELEETRQLVDRLGFTYLHVFPYSARPGTRAAAMEGVVAPEVVKTRSRVLREQGAAANLAFRTRFIGTVLDAVVLESPGADGVDALTANYIKVTLPAGASPGAARVRIVDVEAESTRGVLEI